MRLFNSIIITTVMITLAAMQSADAQSVTSLKLAINTKPTVPVTEGKLAVGGLRTLVTIVEPASAASMPVNWSVSDSSIVALDANTKGKFRGMAPGTAVVTAEVGGAKANYTVVVSQKDAKVGDFFFDNNTWESSGGIVPGKKCIGIVFYVNPDNKQSGKIVSLDEGTRLKWSLASADQPGATSVSDGLLNFKAISSATNWESIFSAEEWCASKTEGNLQWYLPAIDELRQLYAATCGLTWVTPGNNLNSTVINSDWTTMLQTMIAGDETNPYPTERANFNKKFTNIGATALNADGTTRYWSSTEYNTDFAMLLSFEGGYSLVQPRQFDHVGNVRAVAEFKAKQSGSSNVCNISISNSPTKVFKSSEEVIVVADEALTTACVYTVAGTVSNVSVNISDNRATIGLSKLPAGYYIIVVTKADGSRESVKFINN